MLARSQGRRPRPTPRGEVFRVETEPGSGTLQELSPAWTEAVAQAERALTAGRVVAAVGEPGAGRATMLAQAQRRARPRDRILSASSPAAQDTDPWLSLWSPELGKPNTAVVVCDVDALPVWAAERLRELVVRARSSLAPEDGLPISVTAERSRTSPRRWRRWSRRSSRCRRCASDPTTYCPWRGTRPGGCAGARSTSPRVPSRRCGGVSHRLTRIEAFEREEIVRVLTRPGVTMKEAAEELGMSRATIYRKVAQYDIHIPKG